MKNESIRKVINVDKPNYAPLFEFKELDNAVIRLSLFKDSVEFDITGQTVKLGAKTSKGLKEQSEGFTINKNNLDIDLKNSILVPGAVEIDLELKDVSGAMTTASFFITVKSKVLNNKAVESTNEFDTFSKTVAKVEEDYNSLRKIIIDENQAANLQDQVNKTNAQLDNKANKTEVFSMANMGQDIKTAMTGGSVAVVGGEAVNAYTLSREVLNDLYNVNNFLCYKGVLKYIGADGSLANSSAMFTTDNIIQFNIGDYITTNFDNNLIKVALYNQDGTFISASAWLDTMYVFDANCYARVSIKKKDTSNITYDYGFSNLNINKKLNKSNNANVFDKVDLTFTNSYTNDTTGSIIPSSGDLIFTSNHIQVTKNTTLEIDNGYLYQLTFYDNANTFLFKMYGKINKKIEFDDNYTIVISVSKADGTSTSSEEVNRVLNLKKPKTLQTFYEEQTSPLIIKENNITVDPSGASDFTTIKGALDSIVNPHKNNIYNVYIKNGTYNIFNELGGETYFKSLTSGNTSMECGLVLPNYVNLIGLGSNVILECRPTVAQTTDIAVGLASIINKRGTNIIKNLILKAENMRYAVHDETSGISDYYNSETIIENCEIIHYGNDSSFTWGTPNPYAVGFDVGNKYIFKNTKFIAYGWGVPLSFHDRVSNTTPTNIEIDGCEMISKGSISLRLGTVGVGNKHDVLIKDTSMNGRIALIEETSGSSVGVGFYVHGGGNSDIIYTVTHTAITPQIEHVYFNNKVEKIYTVTAMTKGKAYNFNGSLGKYTLATENFYSIIALEDITANSEGTILKSGYVLANILGLTSNTIGDKICFDNGSFVINGVNVVGINDGRYAGYIKLF